MYYRELIIQIEMSNPLKLHFMLYMFHAHQATVHIAIAQNLF